MKNSAALLAILVALPLAGQSAQTTPPTPAPPRSVAVPRPQEKTLSNGLRVIVIEKKGLPLAAARLMVKAGGEADPVPVDGDGDAVGRGPSSATTCASCSAARDRSRASRALPASGTAAATAA